MTVTDEMMMAAASATGHTIHPEDLRKALEAALSASPAGVGVETAPTVTHLAADNVELRNALIALIQDLDARAVTLKDGTKQVQVSDGVYHRARSASLKGDEQ